MRTRFLNNVKRLVIKIGSRVITDANGDPDETVIGAIAAEIARLRAQRKEVVIVTSGAVAAGSKHLALGHRPRTIPQKQAAAAMGQPLLMQAYARALGREEIKLAQILLTSEDLVNRQRFRNAEESIETLLALDIVPIINENDTVVVDEIKFGDNDNLSALVTNLISADLLLILTDTAGLYDADPRSNPDAQLISEVKAITREIERCAGGSGSSVGTGGMATKVAAAKKVGKSGVPTILINGKAPSLIGEAVAGNAVGTIFLPPPTTERLNRRKHWIAYTLRPKGKILVDTGAVRVLSQQGRSLLPSGIVAVDGRFDRGDSVRVCGPDGNEFARGLADYSHSEVERLVGHKSGEIETILGYKYGDEIIHRDNLVVL